MNSSVLELEGTWDEITRQVPDFNGKKLRVTVRVEEAVQSQNANSIDDALAEIWQSTPASAWESLPVDLSDNLDHYLYGTPKRK